jgi:hypothetical protein
MTKFKKCVALNNTNGRCRGGVCPPFIRMERQEERDLRTNIFIDSKEQRL